MQVSVTIVGTACGKKYEGGGFPISKPATKEIRIIKRCGIIGKINMLNDWAK